MKVILLGFLAVLLSAIVLIVIKSQSSDEIGDEPKISKEKLDSFKYSLNHAGSKEAFDRLKDSFILYKSKCLDTIGFGPELNEIEQIQYVDKNSDNETNKQDSVTLTKGEKNEVKNPRTSTGASENPSEG